MGTRAEWSFQILVSLASGSDLCLFLSLCSMDRVCWYSVARGPSYHNPPVGGGQSGCSRTPSQTPVPTARRESRSVPQQLESRRTTLNSESKQDRGCRGNNHKSVSLRHDEETVRSFSPSEHLPAVCPLSLEQPPCAFDPTTPSAPSPQAASPLLKGEAWVLLL